MKFIKFVVSLLVIAGFLGISFAAYKYRRDHRATELEAENAELRNKISDVLGASAKQAIDSEEAKQKMQASFVAEKETIKKALAIVIPDRAKDIENAFKAKVEEDKKEAKTEASAKEAK